MDAKFRIERSQKVRIVFHFAAFVDTAVIIVVAMVIDRQYAMIVSSQKRADSGERRKSRWRLSSQAQVDPGEPVVCAGAHQSL